MITYVVFCSIIFSFAVRMPVWEGSEYHAVSAPYGFKERFAVFGRNVRGLSVGVELLLTGWNRFYSVVQAA
jgi:hypothetical protein